MNKNNRAEMMESGHYKKVLWSLAIPSILASMVTTIYNLIDTFYIGLLKNTAMIAATSVSIPFMMLTQAFGESIGVSAGSYISRQLGAGQKDSVHKIVHTTMTLALLISIVVPAVFLILLDPLMSLFGAEGAVIGYARSYVSILLTLAFTQIFKLIGVHLLRAEGDVTFPMIAIFSGVFANLILDPIFMFEWGLNLGIAGAAWATVAAQGVSMLMLLWRLVFKAEQVKYNPRCLMLDKEVVKEIFTLGIAVFARQALPSLAQSCLTIQAGRFGTEFMAGTGLSRRGLNLVMFAIIGYTQGMQPFAAYNYGAKNFKRLKESIIYSIKVLVSYGTICAIIYAGLAEHIVGLFTDELAVIEVGASMIRGFTLSFPIIGVYNLSAVLLQAFGEKKAAFFLSTARQGLFYIPLVWLLPLLLGKTGVYLTQPLSDYLTVIAVFVIAKEIFLEIYHTA